MKRLAFLLALILAAPAQAQDEPELTGTLRAVYRRSAIKIGVRSSAAPFAFRNKAGQPIGFAVDLCLEIAADVADALYEEFLEPDAPEWRRGIRPEYVTVTPEERIAKVAVGTVDMECGSTTATEERAKTVAFSPVYFVTGTKLMVPRDSGIDSWRDLGGKTVIAAAGTTNLSVIRALIPRAKPPFTVIEAVDLAAAYDRLAAGRADALVSDDVLLAGLLATRPDGKRFRIVGDFMSFEPYGIVFRRGDPDFADLVRQTFARLAQKGRLRTLYNRWFMSRLPTGENLNLPMSPHLTEMFRVLGDPD